MCEFISWVKLDDGNIAFLTAEDINSKYGKETLESSLDNDFIGHGAIRKYYNFDSIIGVNEQNRDFWNGNLPNEIKDAWNSGKLDGMLKHLQSNDLEYILSAAPTEFSMWVVKQRVADWKTAKKDRGYLIRAVAYAATNDWETAKKDSDYLIRAIAYAATNDWETAKKDDALWVRAMAYAAANDWKKAKKDSDCLIRAMAYAAANDWETAKKDDALWVRAMAYAATPGFELSELQRPMIK